MKARMLLTLAVVVLLFSCDPERVEISRQSLDSLNAELQANRQLTVTLAEVGVLLDSIDANRSILKAHMLEGTNYQSYVARMRDLNQYVKKTERKLDALQRTARKSNDAAYKAVIKRLKGDLEVRNSELVALKEQVNTYHNQNDELVKTVSMQKAEIEDKLNQIKTKQIETAQLTEQVGQLVAKARLDQGEALYARAAAVEETANRTHFAPKKKKNTRKQALELYKLALFYGKEEAVEKITALEKAL